MQTHSKKMQEFSGFKDQDNTLASPLTVENGKIEGVSYSADLVPDSFFDAAEESIGRQIMARESQTDNSRRPRVADTESDDSKTQYSPHTAQVAHQGESQLLVALNAENTLYAWEIYCGMAKSKELDLVTANEYNMLIKQLERAKILKRLEKAQELGRLYDNMRTLNMYVYRDTYHALLRAFAKIGHVEKMHKFRYEMIALNHSTSSFFYSAFISAYARIGRADQVELMLSEMKAQSVKPTVPFNCVLLRAYVSFGDRARAQGVWKELELEIANFSATTSVGKIAQVTMAGCDMARHFLKNTELPRKIFWKLRTIRIDGLDVVFKSLLNIAAELGDLKFLSSLWIEIKRRRLRIDSSTLASMIQGAFIAKDFAQAKQYFEYRPHTRFIQRSLMYEAMIIGYAEAGDAEKALEYMGSALANGQAVLSSVYPPLAKALGPEPKPSSMFERHGMLFSARHAGRLAEAYVNLKINVPKSIELIIKDYEAQLKAQGDESKRYVRSLYGELLRGYAEVNDLDMVEKILYEMLKPLNADRASYYIALMRAAGTKANLQQVLDIFNRHFYAVDPENPPLNTVRADHKEKRFLLLDATDAYATVFDSFALATVANSSAINDTTIADLERVVKSVEENGCTGALSLKKNKVSWERVVSLTLLKSCQRAKSILEQYKQDPEKKIVVDTDNLFERVTTLTI